MLGRYLKPLATALFVIFAVALIVGQLLGQPVLLGFVTTGSMEPTLAPGDGFVAIPQPVGGEIREGDVVVFDAEVLHDGGLVTHRVVSVTDEGYVTKGDANPFTDQDGPESLVTDDQIVATALRVGGDVVVIPRLGTAVGGARSVGTAVQTALFGDASDGTAGDVGGFLVLAGALVLFGTLVVDRVGPPSRRRERSRRRADILDARAIAIALLVVVLASANAAMLGPAGAHALGLLSTEDPNADRYAVATGETSTVEVPIHNDGVIPVLVALDGDGHRVTADGRFVISGESTAYGRFSVEAPAEPGQFDAVLIEHRYLLVLPPSALAWLHARDPRLALLAVNFVLALGTLAAVRITLGFDRVRVRSTGVSYGTRLRRVIDSYR